MLALSALLNRETQLLSDFFEFSWFFGVSSVFLGLFTGLWNSVESVCSHFSCFFYFGF